MYRKFITSLIISFAIYIFNGIWHLEKRVLILWVGKRTGGIRSCCHLWNRDDPTVGFVTSCFDLSINFEVLWPKYSNLTGTEHYNAYKSTKNSKTYHHSIEVISSDSVFFCDVLATIILLVRILFWSGVAVARWAILIIQCVGITPVVITSSVFVVRVVIEILIIITVNSFTINITCSLIDRFPN